VDDVASLTPLGPQVEVAGVDGIGVNVHRVAGGAAVHLVNYDVGPDGVRLTDELVLSLRLPGSGGVRRAVLRPADGPALDLPVVPAGADPDLVSLTVPPLGVYAIVELQTGWAA
jgi:hypothetical protein